jgi:glyoxylase-like metal-dependent hydrolase (beta-lactamase superfamily II)
MRIIPLSEGSFSIDQTKQFVPFSKETDDIQQRKTGSLLVEIQPFVVITSEDVLLLDAGLGFTDASGKLQIHENLIKEGINPGEITKVLMTHLHKDHAGGMALPNSAEPAFPQATYFIQKTEWDFAMNKGLPSFVPQELEWIGAAKNIEWLEGDGVINSYIRYEWSGGHSPHHQVFRIVDGGETVFFGGDEAPQLGQMKKKYIAKYDYDGKRAMELRQQWWEQGEKEGWTFLFYHDVNTPTYSFK